MEIIKSVFFCTVHFLAGLRRRVNMSFVKGSMLFTFKMDIGNLSGRKQWKSWKIIMTRLIFYLWEDLLPPFHYRSFEP